MSTTKAKKNTALDNCYLCGGPTHDIVPAFEEYPAVGVCIDCADDNIDGMFDPDDEDGWI